MKLCMGGSAELLYVGIRMVLIQQTTEKVKQIQDIMKASQVGRNPMQIKGENLWNLQLETMYS